MSKSRSNFLKLMLGYLGAQLISFAFYPVLTRIYSPEDFGVFGVFSSIVQLISIYTTGQFHVGMLSKKDYRHVKELFSLSLILNFLSCLVLSLIFCSLYIWGDLAAIYLFVPISVFLYGTMEINKNWAVVRNILGKKAIYININRLTSNIFKLFGSTSFLLVLSEAFANFVGVLLFFRHSLKELEIISTFKNIKRIVLENKHYPIFFTFYVLSQVLSSEAVTLYLKRVLTEHEVGIFFLANKLFVQTALIVSSSLSLSFNYLLIQDQEKRLSIYKKSLRLYVVGLVVAFFLLLPDYSKLVQLIFGDNWTDLSTTINFFFFLSPVKVLVGFFAYILLLDGNAKFIAFFKSIQFLVLVLLLQFGFSNLKEFLWIFIPFEVICDSLFIACGYWLVKRAK
jgi:O-antigen/teichoic acid export membrane protein